MHIDQPCAQVPRMDRVSPFRKRSKAIYASELVRRRGAMHNKWVHP